MIENKNPTPLNKYCPLHSNEDVMGSAETTPVEEKC